MHVLHAEQWTSVAGRRDRLTMVHEGCRVGAEADRDSHCGMVGSGQRPSTCWPDT